MDLKEIGELLVSKFLIAISNFHEEYFPASANPKASKKGRSRRLFVD